MAHIAMAVTNACSPDPRVLRQAGWLVRLGHEVTIHAYDRKEEHSLSESNNGVRIMRYHLGKSEYGGMLKTALGIRKFSKTVSRGLATNKPTLVYCHDADTLPIGCFLKKKYGIPLIFDMHDLQHSWVRMPAPKSIIRRMLSSLMERKMLQRLKKADLILTSSGKISADSRFEGFREYLHSHGYSSVVVENRPEVKSSNESKKSDEWCVGYLGRVRETESFQFLLETILSLEVPQRPKIRIAGDGVAFQSVSEMFESAKKEHGLSVEITGAFDAGGFERMIQDIDVMFAIYSPMRGNILQGALPVKMFDAAAHGVPSVVNDSCLMGELAEYEEIGHSVGWLQKEELAKSLLELRTIQVNLNTTSEREKKRFIEAMKPYLSD